MLPLSQLSRGPWMSNAPNRIWTPLPRLTVMDHSHEVYGSSRPGGDGKPGEANVPDLPSNV